MLEELDLPANWAEAWALLVPVLARLGGAVLLVLLVYVGYRLLLRAVRSLQHGGRITEQFAYPLRRILRWSAAIVGIVVVVQSFGLLQNFWTLLSTVLALIGVGFFAVWSILSNILCAVVLMLTRTFEVDDTITLPAQNLSGKVVNFSLLFTTLRDENGDLIQIPNNTFFQTPIRRRPGAAAVTLEEQLDRPEHAG